MTEALLLPFLDEVLLLHQRQSRWNWPALAPVAIAAAAPAAVVVVFGEPSDGRRAAEAAPAESCLACECDRTRRTEMNARKSALHFFQRGPPFVF